MQSPERKLIHKSVNVNGRHFFVQMLYKDSCLHLIEINRTDIYILKHYFMFSVILSFLLYWLYQMRMTSD